MAGEWTCIPWQLRFGANFVEGESVEFRVWAPGLSNLAVKLVGERERTIPMACSSDAEFSVIVPGLRTGDDYQFLLDGNRLRPDPVSRSQPNGVTGPSQIVDPHSFRWTDQGWNGLPLKDFVTYELHTGTFTPRGTFEAVIERIPYLRDLGITAIELMPVAEFPGKRNWGYDGASLYAPHSAYGGPSGLKKLVDTCHANGLAVVLDVVYNHLGPEGCYLPEYAPCFTNAYRTPWGDAINFDGPESDGVRRYFIDNALYWLTEYHIDALRLDAVHAIFDFSAHHLLDELTTAFHAQARHLGRQAWIIAESDLDDVRIINPRCAGGYGVDAQWHDDFHHALYTLLTGDRGGYLMDFGSLGDLAKSISDGFVYDGKYSRYRHRRHGSSSTTRPGEQFVPCIQNHDQVANTSKGKRLGSLVSLEQQKLAATLLLSAPFLPLLFMGQEYGETAPFLFFTSYHDKDLVAAVRKGRREEFAAYYTHEDFPDPQSESTFQECKLEWDKLSQSPHREILALYRDLLALRRKHECLSNCRKDLSSVTFNENANWLVMRRSDEGNAAAMLICNFSDHELTIPIDPDGRSWSLMLGTNDTVYGRSDGLPLSETISPGKQGVEIILSKFSAALYLVERSESAATTGRESSQNQQPNPSTDPATPAVSRR